MCPLVSAFACQPEPTGFYHKQLPTCPCGLLALVLVSTSALSKRGEKIITEWLRFWWDVRTPFHRTEAEIAGLTQWELRSSSRGIFSRQAEGPGWRLEVPPCLRNHRPHISPGNLTFVMIRAVTLQVRRVARETCRKTGKVRRDGWRVSLPTEIN